MDFKELKSFVSVVDNEGISIASKKLFMTQPAISTHIKLLEKELNTKLLKSENKKMYPTPKGMELYDYAKKILNLENDFKKSLMESNKDLIKIGVSSVPSLLCLPELIEKFSKKNKSVSFRIYQNDSKKITQALKNDLIDIGLIGMDIYDKEISCDAFYKDTMVLIMPNTSEYKNISGLNIFKKPFIIREDGSGSKKSIINFLSKLNIDISNLDIIGEINNQDTILKLVASGIGISITSKKVALDYQHNKKLLFKEFPNIKNERNLNIIYKSCKNKNYIKNFVSFTKSFYK